MSSKLAYQVLARKWRPKTFAEMVGQEATVRTLANALTQERLHHAYLFTGTRGVGKTTIARIIAKCLNCEQGITATPCGRCNICTSIDKGQFMDLIEVDAASRTKVEDTRELLDNVQYAPSQGRFKIYLIDEVHMLSGHSFNALLKTLEEPPEHVKFLLATTDPQKLPMTVLSRCLQFHLKGMTPETISKHLQHILADENIGFDEQALLELADAANGSMRDALSLLDQAIAYSDGTIDDNCIRELLGNTAAVDLYPFLDALINKNGSALIKHLDMLGLQGLSFSQVLTDFMCLLQRITRLQLAADIDMKNKETLKPYAEKISGKAIQSYYQIALIGKRDLAYAPTERSGFEMVLFRMLRLALNNNETVSAPEIKLKPIEPIVQKTKTEAPEKQNPIATSWHDIVGALEVSGMTKVLAQNCALIEKTNTHIKLSIDTKHASLMNDRQKKQLHSALEDYLSVKINFSIDVSNIEQDTPAITQQRDSDEKAQQTKNSLVNDPQVQSILQDFGGSLDEKSIKSTK